MPLEFIRKEEEAFLLRVAGIEIRVVVTKIRFDRGRLPLATIAVTAPKSVVILREELDCREEKRA